MSDIGIIGGADGPTAVFVANELSMVTILGIAAAAIVVISLVVVTVVMTTRGDRK